LFLCLAVLPATGPAKEDAVKITNRRAGQTARGQEAKIFPDSSWRIIYPRLTSPALVTLGGNLEVTISIDHKTREISERAGPIPEARIRPVCRSAALAWTNLEFLSLARTQGRLELQFHVPARLGPDNYDLLVRIPGRPDKLEASSVRIYRPTRDYTFAVVADQQFGDPTAALDQGNFNPGLYHGAQGNNPSKSLADQARSELEMLDPLFVLDAGDIVFGMDYKAEYAGAQKYLGATRAAIFAVPGNHDGYNLEKIAISRYWPDVAGDMLMCGKSLLVSSIDISDALVEMVKCLIRNTPRLFEWKDAADGLEIFQKTLGPLEPAFSVPGLDVFGINTYGGSRARRAALAVPFAWAGNILDLAAKLLPIDSARLDRAKKLLRNAGAPLVDNYGGFMTMSSLERLKVALCKKTLVNRPHHTIVVFGHQDPRGNLIDGETTRYTENKRFPTNPFGLGAFNVWDFDGQWDSDPSDRNGVESRENNSGTGLLKILSPCADYYFFGHAHEDVNDLITKGARIAGTNPVAGGDLHMVETTTLGASTRGNGYRGYRLVHVENGNIKRLDFAPDLGLGSIPLGNLWMKDLPGRKYTIYSTLPRAVNVRKRFILDASSTGYDFLDKHGKRIPISELSDLGSKTAMYIETMVPAAKDTATLFKDLAQNKIDIKKFRRNIAGKKKAQTISIETPRHNTPPLPIISLLNNRPLVRGEKIRLSAASTRDKEGDKVPWLFWRIGKHETSGTNVEYRLQKAGKLFVELTAFDEHGARSMSSKTFEVLSKEQARALRKGSTWRIILAWSAILLLIALLLALAGGRRSRNN